MIAVASPKMLGEALARGYDAAPRRWRAIDRDALAALYRLHGPAVHRRARVILRDDDEARDVMQEVFTRLVAHHAKLRGDVPVLHWLYRVTTNVSLARLRRKRTHPVVVDPDALARLASGSEAQQVDRMAALAMLGRLRPLAREIAVYYYLDRMTMEEIGAVMGRSRKTVGRQLAIIQRQAQAMLS